MLVPTGIGSVRQSEGFDVQMARTNICFRSENPYRITLKDNGNRNGPFSVHMPKSPELSPNYRTLCSRSQTRNTIDKWASINLSDIRVFRGRTKHLDKR